MNEKKVELEFPLDWEYKLIALDTPEMGASIAGILKNQGFNSTPSAGNRSKNGKYRTYHVQARIESRESLDNLARALSACPGVKFLL